MRVIHASSGAFLCAVACAVAPVQALSTAGFVQNPIPPGTPINNPNSVPGSGTLDGFFSYDLRVQSDTDWQNAALLVSLTSGSIYQEGEGFGANGYTIQSPDPAGFGVFPSSEFDSYIQDPHGLAAVLGGAGDVGGDVLAFSTSQIDISWSSTPDDVFDVGTYSLARVTLSADAQGFVRFAYRLKDVIETMSGEFPIVNGRIVPEPASFSLMGLASLACLRRRV